MNDGENVKETLDWQAKAEEYLDGWKRALADYQNLKKETEKEKQSTLAIGLRLYLNGLLMFVDNFEKSLAHVPDELKNKDWVLGIERSFDMLSDYLKNLGAEKIALKNKKFDPRVAEAVGNETMEEVEDGVVVQELRSAYKLKGELLRPAKVVVNKLKH